MIKAQRRGATRHRVPTQAPAGSRVLTMKTTSRAAWFGAFLMLAGLVALMILLAQRPGI